MKTISPDFTQFNLHPLSSKQISDIDQATLRVLSEVGIMLDDTQAKKILLDSGASVKQDRVCIPPGLAQDCLKQCPKQVVLRGRSNMVMLGDGQLHVHNMGGARDALDHPHGDIRPATARDVAQSTRLLDAMDSVTTITPLYTPRDVPANMMVLAMFDQTLRNTTKPINGPGVRTADEVKLIKEMAQVVLGDQPVISLGASPVSPLNFLGEIAQVILEIARQGLPFGPLPCPNVGATSPMSLAGSLVQQNAEVLASIVLAQLIQPGLPTVYCGRLSVLNMRSGAPIWGNPEVGILSAATVQIGHFYNLPVNVYGLAGSGFAPDMQSGYERAINALVPALAGADELSGVGEMAGGTISSHAQIVIDNDIISMVQRVRRGFLVSEDSLAVDIIANAMETTHNFLRQQHTRKYLHQGEVWQGQLGINEISWETWQAAGSPSVVDRAQSEVQRILTQHEIPPIPQNQSQELDKILEHARNTLD